MSICPIRALSLTLGHPFACTITAMGTPINGLNNERNDGNGLQRSRKELQVRGWRQIRSLHHRFQSMRGIALHIVTSLEQGLLYLPEG